MFLAFLNSFLDCMSSVYHNILCCRCCRVPIADDVASVINIYSDHLSRTFSVPSAESLVPSVNELTGHWLENWPLLAEQKALTFDLNQAAQQLSSQSRGLSDGGLDSSLRSRDLEAAPQHFLVEHYRPRLVLRLDDELISELNSSKNNSAPTPLSKFEGKRSLRMR